MPKPYLWHPNHELDHKFLHARQDITYKSLITEHRVLTRVELNVQKLSEVADLSPTGVLNTALAGIVWIRMYSVYRIVGNFHGQVDLHENFPHNNVGVAYRNACNEIKRNLYSLKSPFSSKTNFLPHEKITCYIRYYIVFASGHGTRPAALMTHHNYSPEYDLEAVPLITLNRSLV